MCHAMGPEDSVRERLVTVWRKWVVAGVWWNGIIEALLFVDGGSTFIDFFGKQAPPFQSMHTSSSTPAADMIEGAWLCLKDIFHVVYMPICAPGGLH